MPQRWSQIGSVILATLVIGVVTVLYCLPGSRPRQDRTSPAQAKPVLAAVLTGRDGIVFPLAAGDRVVHLVTHGLFPPERVLEAAEPVAYALEVRLVDPAGTVVSRQIYHELSQFVPLAPGQEDGDQERAVWRSLTHPVSAGRLTTVHVERLLPEGGQLEITLEESPISLVIQAYKRTQTAGPAGASPKKALSEAARQTLARQMGLGSVAELTTEEWAGLNRWRWFPLDARAQNPELREERCILYPGALRPAPAASGETLVLLPPGRKTAFLVVGPVKLEILRAPGSAAAALKIWTVHVEGHPSQKEWETRDFPPDHSELLALPEGVQSLVVENPTAAPALFRVATRERKALAQGGGPWIMDPAFPGMFLLRPQELRLAGHLIGPGGEGDLSFSTLGFEGNVLRLEIRAPLEGRDDTRERSLELILQDEGGQVLSRQTERVPVVASTFERLELDPPRPLDGISEPVVLNVHPGAGARRLRVTSRDDLWLRASQERPAPAEAVPLPRPAVKDRFWRYSQARELWWMVVRPERPPGVPELLRGTVVAVRRLEKRPPLPPEAANWVKVGGGIGVAQDLLFEQVTPEQLLQPAAGNLWCRCEPNRKIRLPLPPDPAGEDLGMIDALYVIPGKVPLAGTLQLLEGDAQLTTVKPVSRQGTIKVRGIKNPPARIEYRPSFEKGAPWLLVRIQDVMRSPRGCSLFRSHAVSVLAPGAEVQIPVRKPRGEDSLIHLATFGKAPAALELRLDGARPRRKAQVLLAGVTHARKQVAPGGGAGATPGRAWSKNRPERALRADPPVFFLLREDLEDGWHTLTLRNNGSKSFLYRVSQRYTTGGAQSRFKLGRFKTTEE